MAQADGGTANGVIHLGDVVTEVNSIDVTGKPFDWRYEGGVQLVRVIREKGYVPLPPGTEVRLCKSILSRVNKAAASFEVDLTQALNSSGEAVPATLNTPSLKRQLTESLLRRQRTEGASQRNTVLEHESPPIAGGANSKGNKTRYVFICQSEDAANMWVGAVRKQVNSSPRGYDLSTETI